MRKVVENAQTFIPYTAGHDHNLYLTDGGVLRKKTVHRDGVYEATSVADDRGYATAKVTIKDDKITTLELREFTEKAVEKDFATYPYPQAKQARDALTQSMMEKNGPEVENFTGATNSSIKFKDAVSKALEKSKREPALKTTYFDGTFMGRSKQTEHGYGIALVTIQNDKITNVKLDEVTENDEFKNWETYPYKQALEARDTLQKQFVEKNGTDVDVITGATSSSNLWKEAVGNALASAKIK